MKKSRNHKNNLDERQEQTLLRIEHNGCWLAFWGLAAALVVQRIFFDFDFRNLAGECIVFMALALYIAVGCLRQGIWDRYLKPNTSSNVIVSLTAALITGILGFIRTVKSFPDKIAGSLASGIMYAMITFAVCFAVLQLSADFFRKKQAKLEEEPQANEEEGDSLI